jgi:hypothetical protein
VIDADRLRRLRATRPEAILETAAARHTRLPGARLLILAADHPARGALAVGTAPMAMASRADLLSRLVTALQRPGVDGVLGTPDVIEDLLLLGALDRKVVIGSMNRGGLAGASFALDDRFTAYDPETIASMRLNGGKMLLRIDPQDPATATTLEAAGRAITQLAGLGLMAMVEPFIVSRNGGHITSDLRPDAVIRSIAIAGGLGATSRHTWLKLPVVAEMERVMEATTLPTLLLGGDPAGMREPGFDAWEGALRLPGVHGLVVGRSLLYPPDGDVTGAVDTAAELVHRAAANR